MFTDEQRLEFLMKEADIDSFFRVKKDRYDYAVEVMEEEGHTEPTDLDKLEGFRRMVDAAMAAYKITKG